MLIKIEQYNESLKNEWDEFIASSINGTFLHSRDFYNHNHLNSLDDYSLIFRKDNNIVAVIPATMYEKNKVKIIHSHPRSTYGGIVIKEKTATSLIFEVIDVLIEHCKSINVNELIVRPVFSIYSNNEADNILYALYSKGFLLYFQDIEFAIVLNEDYKKDFSNSSIRAIKKAKKSEVKVSVNKDLNVFWQILSQNLIEKHQAKPVHNIHEITRLVELVGDNKVKLFVASLNEEILGGILTFVTNKNVIHAQYIASKSEFQELRPLNLIIEHISDWAYNNGFKYFNLGMSNEPGEKKLNEGLTRFKESFGSKALLRQTYKKEL